MTTGYNAEEKYFKEKDAELLEALIHQTVWVLSWNWKNGGDHGQFGAWFHRPSEKEQEAFMREKFPVEFDNLNWEVSEFTIAESIG
tara:strand:+ start:199 stop:456 length:258 start_codon:yes stop_codon:yes gene_type:complete